MSDLSEYGRRSAIHLGFCTTAVLSDGSINTPRDNVAHVQFINNSAQGEGGMVDVYVNERLVVNDLSLGSATPFVDVPSGLREDTAPDIKVVVRSSGGENEEPLFTMERKFLFGHRYVSVLAGDEVDPDGAFPLALYLTDLGIDPASQQVQRHATVFHGATGTRAVILGMGQTTVVPLTQRLTFGAFETNVPVPFADTTLVILDADDRRLLGSYDLNLATMGLADSAIVLLTSTNVLTGVGGQPAAQDIGILAAVPSGGKLISFAGSAPPPWWQKPWMLLLLLAGVVAVAFAGSQLRVRRLEARSRELERTVEERTQELRAEKEKTEEQARRLAELDEAKNRFFANISHEFRTPLTLILGPVQDFLDGAFGPLSGQARTQHRLMRRNARRLLRLVNQLLDLSRLESGKMTLSPEPGDLVSFLHELHRVFVPMAERREVSLGFEPRVQSIPGMFDFDALEKVFTNLISNALKFTPEAGDVVVAVQVIPTEPAEEGPLAPFGMTAVVSVTDTGPGIPEEQLDRIFERFHQADSSIRRRYEGSGVGLTLARELAELQGGTLVAESTVGKGSVFTVSLPIVEVEEGAVVDVPIPQHAHLESPLLTADDEGAMGGGDGFDAKQSTILVVEDNPDVREYLRSHLANRYRLLEAEDGQAGLELANLQKPDLILSDVMMPVMDGLEMCRLIKSNDELRHIPVIMLTAKVSEKDAVEGLESAAEDYISKPFSINELEAKILNFVAVRRDLREKFSREVIVKPGDIVITPEEEIFLDGVLEVVNEHLGDTNFSVDWLAEEVGMSRRNLERKVEGTTGQTPADLVRSLRLQRASQLLRAHAGSVAEIAYSVGFNSPKHFATVFKQKYGESPSEHAGKTT
ncbi:MAG: response regulator [Rhodothermales bacterium]